MADSDSDDMPPPLEDMSEQIAAHQKGKAQQAKKNVEEDEGEEIRLAPKKPETQNTETSKSNITRIMPSDDGAQTQKKPLV